MESLDPRAAAFYCDALEQLGASNVPFLVGGAYAMERYTAIVRHTRDLDLFVRPRDHERALAVLGTMGCQTEVTFPHWLGKAFCGEFYVDLIWSSGNAVANVDEGWFAHAIDATVLGIPVRLCPPEELIWSKAFVMERERYDGADVVHILRARGSTLGWRRLLARFGPHWRVLLSHLVLFGFVYPTEANSIPQWVMRKLTGRLEAETAAPPATERVCRGTLLSRAQYLSDVERWGYLDPRVAPAGNMTSRETAIWTAAAKDR